MRLMEMLDEERPNERLQSTYIAPGEKPKSTSYSRTVAPDPMLFLGKAFNTRGMKAGYGVLH